MTQKWVKNGSKQQDPASGQTGAKGVKTRKNALKNASASIFSVGLTPMEIQRTNAGISVCWHLVITRKRSRPLGFGDLESARKTKMPVPVNFWDVVLPPGKYKQNAGKRRICWQMG